MYELIRVSKLPETGIRGFVQRDYSKVIRRKCNASWKVDLQLCTSIYICKLSALQVSEAPHIAQFSCHTWAIEEQEANFSGKLHSICLTSCETRSKPRWILPSRYPWLYDQYQEQKECLLAFLDVKNAVSLWLCFCCTSSRIIISFLCVRID